MTIQAGMNPAETLTSAERIASGKGFAAGDIYHDANGNRWLYVQAGGAVPQYNIVRVLASANQAVVFTSAGVGGTAGAVKCYGISASASIASGSYGWVMTHGTAAVKVSASATGTYVPTALIYASGTAAAGLAASTASGNFAALGVSVATTATTSTTGSTVPIVFFHGIQMTTAAE